MVKLRIKNIFYKEAHYFCATSFLIFAYVSLMHFFFRASWADSGSALWLVSIMRHIVPAIRRLGAYDVAYASYWGFFFSLFWITAPIYWLLGFLGAPRLSADRYKKLVTDTTTIRVVLIFVLATWSLMFVFLFPILSGMYCIRQTSDFFPVLAFSWWTSAGVVYCQAQMTRVLMIKIA